MNYGLSKSAEIVLSKSISYVKNKRIFSKENSLKNINLGDHFFVKNNFFLTSIFDPLYFLKSCQILANLHSLYSQNTMDSFEHIDFWPKILLFRTQHL